MLEEGDQDEPVVDPEVRDTIDDGNFGKATFVAPESESTDHGDKSGVGKDNVPELALLEDDRRWRKVVGTLGVAQLATGVLEEVQRPSKDLVEEEVPERDNRRLVDGFSEIGLTLLRDVDTGNLGLFDDLGETKLFSGSWDKDLVSGEVTGSGVVLTVGDTPAVERD